MRPQPERRQQSAAHPCLSFPHYLWTAKVDRHAKRKLRAIRLSPRGEKEQNLTGSFANRACPSMSTDRHRSSKILTLRLSGLSARVITDWRARYSQSPRIILQSHPQPSRAMSAHVLRAPSIQASFVSNPVRRSSYLRLSSRFCSHPRTAKTREQRGAHDLTWLPPLAMLLRGRLEQSGSC